MGITFSPDLFHDKERLARYVRCEHFQKELVAPSSGCCLRSLKKIWEVSYYVTTTPFLSLTYLIVKIITKVPLSKKLACRVFFLEKQLITQIKDCPIQFFGELSFRICNHAGFTSAVGAHQSVPISAQTKIGFQEDLFTKNKHNLSLRKTGRNGLCLGLSFLFASLICKLQDHGLLTKLKVQEIARKLQYGGHDQALILQTMQQEKTILELLNLTETEEITHRPTQLLEDLKASFQALNPGVYIVRLPLHQGCLIKLPENSWCYFDPGGKFSMLNSKNPASHFFKVIEPDVDHWEERLTCRLKDFPEDLSMRLAGANRSLVTFYKVNLMSL